MNEEENPIINENSDLKSMSTIQKVLILQNLLKEFTSKRQIFFNEKENLLSKIDNKCYQYFKGRINVKKAFDYILKNDLTIKNRNYILRKDNFENSNDTLNKSLYNFYFLLQNDFPLMLKLIELVQNGNYKDKDEELSDLSDFFVHFLFVNLINSSYADEKLILLIYLLLEKLIINDLPNKIEINNDIPMTYLQNTFLFQVFKSLTRKIDIRNFLGNILNNFIQRFENLGLTLSTQIADVNGIVNVRNAFIYRSFITDIGSLKEEEMHLKRKKFKKAKDGNILINTNNQNISKFALKRAKKIFNEASVIEQNENPGNNNVPKLTKLDDKINNNNIIEEKKVDEEKNNYEAKQSNEFKKRKENIRKIEEKKEKEENNKHKELKLGFDIKTKKKENNRTIIQTKKGKNLINALSITKGTSENSPNDPNKILENISGDEKIPVDEFFKKYDLTNEKIKEILEEYNKKTDGNNNINSAMKEYLNNLITQEENIYSSSSFVQELTSISSIKSNQNFFSLMRKILINFKIISKVITNIINDLSKNLSSLSYIIKCIFKIMEQLLNKKYSQEKNNKLTAYQIYMFKINFLIGNIILPILKEPNFNGIITTNIISETTKKNLEIVYDIFDKMITGKLFKKNGDYSMVLYNKFIIETLPKLFGLINSIENNIELPNCVNKLINDNSNQRNINYDYFKENPEENIEYQSICISLTNIYIFMNIIGSNNKILIDKDEKQEEKNILKDFANNMDIIKEKYNNEQQGNKREFVYLTRVLYSDEFKHKIESICNNNIYGTIPKNGDDFVIIIKKFLLEILNYANIIQYENFYDLSELKTDKTIKINKSKKFEKEKAEKNSNDICSKNRFKTSLSSSLIRIVKSKKEDDVDFIKVIFPHIIKNILFEMNLDKNDEFNQRISFYINYLQLHIKNLPKKYIENNYGLLFDELIKETKNKKKVVTSNLLIEYFKKVKEAERVCMKSLEFNSQIKNLENLKYIDYLYNNITLPNDFLIENDQNGIISNFKYINKNTLIKDIIRNFPNFREYEKDYDNILDIEEKANVPKAIENYFIKIGKVIQNELFPNKNIKKLNETESAELTNVQCLFENYVLNQLFDKLFPTLISEIDLFIYKKCERLAFLTPENVIKEKKIINEKLLNEAVKKFEELDEKITPLDKLKCFDKGLSIIKNSITFNTGKIPGADDTVEPMIYVMLKAKPKNLVTNAQYCQLYLNKSVPEYYKYTCENLIFITEILKTPGFYLLKMRKIFFKYIAYQLIKFHDEMEKNKYANLK